jgi:hypothetical protein
MLDPIAQKKDEIAHAIRIAKACTDRIDGILSDKAVEYEVREQVAKLYIKDMKLRGCKLTDAEMSTLAYFQAGLLT